MIIPINNHILIEPLKHESFVSSDRQTYEEVGVVLETFPQSPAKRGDKVFFDSWLAAKYPTGKGDEYFWLVRSEDIRAIEQDENRTPFDGIDSLSSSQKGFHDGKGNCGECNPDGSCRYGV